MRLLIPLLLLLFLPLVTFSNTLYINEIPDFLQTSVKGGNSGNGQQYCAPAAVSNSLFWLNNKTDGQLSLIKKLASKKYMNTSLRNSTGTTGLLRGVSKISKELFGGYRLLEYQGWRKHPKKYSKGVKIPQYEWLTNGVSQTSATWLNIGWYKHYKDSNEYSRVGGHWVTLVGYSNDAIIIHDPSPRAGSSFQNEYVTITPLKSGTLVGNKKGLPTSAKGYYSLGEGMHIKSRADLAILDGAVRLQL